MKLGNIVKSSFIISTLLTMVGAYLIAANSEEAGVLMIMAIIPSLVFIVSAIYEIRTSTKIDSSEKTMWTIALIISTGIAGLIYFFFARKRIAADF